MPQRRRPVGARPRAGGPHSGPGLVRHSAHFEAFPICQIDQSGPVGVAVATVGAVVIVAAAGQEKRHEAGD